MQIEDVFDMLIPKDDQCKIINGKIIRTKYRVNYKMK